MVNFQTNGALKFCLQVKYSFGHLEKLIILWCKADLDRHIQWDLFKGNDIFYGIWLLTMFTH